MSRRARRRAARAFAACAAAVGIGGGLVVAGVASRSPGAAAAGGDQVYVGGGIINRVLGYSLPALSAGLASPNQQSTPQRTVSALAINVTGTKVIVGGPSSRSGSPQPPFTVQVEDVATGALTPATDVPGQPVAFAADPRDGNTAYVLLDVNGGAEVDIINVGSSPPGDSLLVSTLTLSNGGSPVFPTAMAISPDGQTLFVGGEGDGWIDIYAVNVANPSSVVYWQSNNGEVFAGSKPFNLTDLVVSPGDNLVFATGNGSNGSAGEGSLFALQLVGSTLTGTAESPAWSDGLTTGVAGQQPPLLPMSMTVSPDASTLYVGGNNNQGTPASVDAFSAATGQHGADAQLIDQTTNANVPQSGLASVAMSPDGRDVLAAGTDGTNGSDTSFIDILAAGNLGTVATSTSLGARFAPAAPESIAVSPEQFAPPAAFTATVAQAGQPTTFTAATPPALPGMSFSYSWSFGAVGQTVSSVFSAPGSYPVTLSVTPRSPDGHPVDTPGQTPYWRGVTTSTTQTVVIPALPPPTTPHGSTTTTTVPHKPGVPAIKLNPTVGPPGTIVTVSGSGFKPNQHVTLSWSVSTGSVMVIADSHGNLPPNTQMLILTPDILGPRMAVANTNPEAKAAFLVVPNTAEPGGDNAVFLFRSEGP